MARDIETVSSRLVYENRWMRVREDAIVRRDGSPGIYGVVEKADFAVIVPVHEGMLYLVEQYRYPVEARYWELPQGSWEAEPDTSPDVLARAELLEETGLVATHLEHVGRLYECYGHSNQAFDIFLATGLSMQEAKRELEEQDMVCQAFPLETVVQMILDGAVKDAATVAAIGMLRLKQLL